MRLALPAFVAVLGSAVAWAGPERTHSGSVPGKRIEVRFRPGSRAAADADRQSAAAERDLDRIAQALDAKPAGPFVLWIYDDVDELSDVTSTTGNAGFSTGSASHVPFDADQTRLHELCHVVTAEWPKSGPEARNLFPVEGIANAVLTFVHGVHVHAVAAWYRKEGKLPALATLLDAEDFYAWLRAHPEFDAYDVAGSWMRFLLDEHGVAKTRRWYTGTPAKAAFGHEIPALEKAWHAALDAFPLRPEVATLLRSRHGEDVRFAPLREGVPAAILGKPGDWKSLLAEDLRADRPERWKREGKVLRVANDADEWTGCDFGSSRFGDCVVRVRVATTAYTPVQVRFSPDNQVMHVQPGTFLFRGEKGLASDAAVGMPLGPARREIVVARRGRRLDVWIDGRKALQTDLATDGPLPVGVGVHKGSAVFEEVSVRSLR